MTGCNETFGYVNEFNKKYGVETICHNYTAFYVGIGFCTVIGLVLLLVNWICCCCHEHTPYWSDPDTGNRFASLLFVRKPKQRPLDVLLT